MIEKLILRNFTVFKRCELAFSPQVNLLIGDNGTGKTHLLKILYATQFALRDPEHDGDIDLVGQKIIKVFSPLMKNHNSLYRQKHGGTGGPCYLDLQINGRIYSREIARYIPLKTETPLVPDKPVVYIPVKEILANAPGLKSLYSHREISFEEIYIDILEQAYLPPLRNPNPECQKIMDELTFAIKGEVIQIGETFYLKENAGEIEFTMVAEGIRKLALLWLLIRNGSLSPGATLYWDEPETNLNPLMFRLVVNVLLKLAKMGVQIFIATHSYPLLKEFDLQKNTEEAAYFSLFFMDDTSVAVNKFNQYKAITPNKIAEEHTRIYDLEVERTLGVIGG